MKTENETGNRDCVPTRYFDNQRMTRTWRHLAAVIALGTIVTSAASFAGTLVFDPGGPKDGLPIPTLNLSDGRRDQIRGLSLTFDQPSILQRSSDLTSGHWENVTTTSPFVVKNEDLTGTCFYRVVAAERPVTVHVPDSYDPEIPAPLFIGLHGRGGTGPRQEAFFGFTGQFEAHGIVSCWPNGSEVSAPGYAWSSIEGEPDSGYLLTLIDEVRQKLQIDPKRIFVFGYSNGGRMALRMGCDHANTVAAVVSLAGALHRVYEPAGCSSSQPVNLLHIHGTQDPVVNYAQAVATLEQWAAAKGCGDIITEDEMTLNLIDGPAPETRETRYLGCTGGTSTVLWTIVGGTHDLVLTDDFRSRVIEWLLAHPKP